MDDAGHAMSQIPEGPILDYASPALKSPLRLTDLSILTVQPITDGIEVLETLTGKGAAIAAMIFSAGTVALFGFETFTSDAPNAHVDFGTLQIFYLIYLAITLILMFAIIESNWRETILRVQRENLTLAFKSPFKLRQHRWTTEMVRQIHVVQAIDTKTERLVHELQIELSSSSLQWVKLFTGHDAPELGNIAGQLRAQVSRAVPGPVPGEAAPAKLN
jgi:hypothetical protein